MKRIPLLLIHVLLLLLFSPAARGNIPEPSPAPEEKTNYQGSDDILFDDYRLFMIYTRDSIMRQILSEELADFCLSYASQYECGCLDWNIPINLNHDEITEILSNYADYGDNIDFLKKENDEYYVDTTYLIYRAARSDENGINIFPDFYKLDPQNMKNIESRFGTDNNWNESLDGKIINKILSSQQIEAYRDWNNKIGVKKAKKMTRSKVIKPGFSNGYGT
jgi:hypothetical protein